MNEFVAGFGLGISLILAIGAQNAFVLRQGIERQYVLMVSIICALSDAILISLGVFGFGEFIQSSPNLLTVARFAGAGFLVIYGAMSFHSALTQSHRLVAGECKQQSRWPVALACLAFTWLNPHVYLDTVVMLGSISTQFAPNQHLFAWGAVSASFVFFFSLGFGARLLTPLFARAKAWQTLELLIGVMMWGLAALLLT